MPGTMGSGIFKVDHFVCYSDHYSNKRKNVHYSDHYLNDEHFGHWTGFDHFNAPLVSYSDLDCIKLSFVNLQTYLKITICQFSNLKLFTQHV